MLSRRTSAWSVAVVSQTTATVCVAALALGGGGHPGPGDLAWGLLAGVGAGAGAGFLYRGFAAGRMAVVAPVSAVGSALVPVVAGGLGGERPSTLVWLGVAAALPGTWLVSTSSAGPGGPGAISAGVLDGMLAGLGFGGLFAALGQVPDGAGWWPLALTQAAAVPTVVALAVLLRASWVPRGRTVWWAVLMGALGAAATGFFLLAAQQGYLTVAGVITSLYPASTVLLAAVVLRERIGPVQGVGLALCGVAVALVAVG